ncbi:hypothetical protein AYI68_g7009, partial [Smittium mucronatum]
MVAGRSGKTPFTFSGFPGGQVSGQKNRFFPQIGSDPLHGGRFGKVGNQSDGFVDFGLDWFDSGFTYAKGLSSVSVRCYVSRN